MKNIQKGQIVRSLAGRDKGRFFLVVDLLDENHVLLSDGELRKVSLPKKKKIKHIAKTNQIDVKLQEALQADKKITNAEVRKSLSKYQDAAINNLES